MTDKSTDLIEMEKILNQELIGHLGMVDADGRPYVVALNYSYADGRILFHCGLEGKKLDCIGANPSVCFSVASQTGIPREHHGDPCHLDSDSVIAYGRSRIVDDLAEREKLLNQFNRRFRPNAEGVSAKQVGFCRVVEIVLTELTGRQERARKRTLWRHVFE